MTRQIVMVIIHGVMKKVWIDPKDIHNESDVPFVPPEYPTKEQIKEKAQREAEKAELAKREREKNMHADWNKPAEAKPALVKPDAVVIKTDDDDEPREKHKYTKRGGKRR